MVLFSVTIASYPIAVELIKPVEDPFALFPKNVLLLPVVTTCPAASL